MKENTYPLFKKGCLVALFIWVVSMVFWQSSVLSFCLGAMPVILTMVWRDKEFPSFPFALLFQWMQVSVGIIWRDVFGVARLNAVDHPKADMAVYLGIIGLFVMALGLRFGFLLSSKIIKVKPADDSGELNYSIGKLFAIYLILLFLAPIIAIASWNVMQIRSVLVTVFTFQHFIVFMLFYLAIINNRSFFIVVTLLLEVVQGMVGYFSGYKTSLLIFAIVAFADLRKLTLRMRYILLTVLFTLFILSIVWQAVKPELRQAFSSGALSLSSPFEDKIKFVSALIEKIFRGNTVYYQSGDRGGNKVQDLVNRISNVYYFACTLERVPSEMPHEDGKLLMGGLTHIFTPRLFFPDKPGVPSDSWMVRTYAGKYVAGEEQDTSIALGYLVENYVDFGIPYMFIPVFIIGILAAIMYRYIFKIAANLMLANVLSASIFFFNFYLFEKANIKIFGNLLSDYIVCVITLRLFQKQFLKFITKKDYHRAV